MQEWLPRVPRILIIDDELGDNINRIQREAFCKKCNLIDVTDNFKKTIPSQCSKKQEPSTNEPGMPRENEYNYYSVEAVFCSGQDEKRINNLDIVQEFASANEELAWNWSLILVDMNFMQGESYLPSIFGPEIIEYLVEKNPAQYLKYETDLPIVMMTVITESELDKIKEKVRNYARGYFSKQVLIDSTISSTSASKKIRNVIEEYGYLEDIGPFCGVKRKKLIGRSIPFLEMLRKARRYSRLLKDSQILLLGETGTGKSILAKFLYEQILLVENKEANEINYLKYQAKEGNAENESGNFFGHWEEAYTGANSAMPGKAELAHKGVLFVDEIANWGLASQSHMLEYFAPEFNEMRIVDRDGNFPTSKAKITEAINSLVADQSLFNEIDHTIEVQSTIITATNVQLDKIHEENLIYFRPDLYHRLTEFIPPITMPPLRDRAEDIEMLFRYAMNEVSKKLYKRNDIDIPILDGTAIEFLKNQKWHGNLRELFSKARLALIFSKDWGVVTDKSFH